MDKATEQRINLLHPKLRTEVISIIEYLNTQGVNIRITQGLRNIAEQDALYAQGRTKPGKIVTNAKGGQSWHNWGLAVDFCLLHKDYSISWSMIEDIDKDNKADWMEVVAAFKKFGWSWGGDWKRMKDTPHFEKTFGLTLSSVKLKEKDIHGYIIL